MRLSLITLFAAATLSGCGFSLADRSISGAAIGAAGTALIGGHVVTGAAVGAAVGALTNAETIDLGDPLF